MGRNAAKPRAARELGRRVIPFTLRQKEQRVLERS